MRLWSERISEAGGNWILDEIPAGSLGGYFKNEFGWKLKYWLGTGVVKTVGTGWGGHLPANGEVEPSYYSKEIIGLCVKGKIERD